MRYQAQLTRTYINGLLFERQVGAFCWVHAINMSLGCVMIEIAHSLDITREFCNERANDDCPFHINGHYNFSIANRLSRVLGTFETKLLSEFHFNANDRLKLDNSKNNPDDECLHVLNTTDDSYKNRTNQRNTQEIQ